MICPAFVRPAELAPVAESVSCQITQARYEWTSSMEIEWPMSATYRCTGRRWPVAARPGLLTQVLVQVSLTTSGVNGTRGSHPIIEIFASGIVCLASFACLDSWMLWSVVRFAFRAPHPHVATGEHPKPPQSVVSQAPVLFCFDDGHPVFFF
jgi:hypothetical protein